MTYYKSTLTSLLLPTLTTSSSIPRIRKITSSTCKLCLNALTNTTYGWNPLSANSTSRNSSS